MTPFLFLAALVFILLVCLLKSAFLHTPKAPLKHNVETLHKRLAKLPVKKQKKRRVSFKLGHHITFEPNFKNRQWKAEPKLIFMGHTLQSSTAVFFSDPYHIFQTKTDGPFAKLTRLFDVNLPDQGKNYVAPAMHCNGLFALTTANNVLICNPTTKEVLTLPQSSNVHVLRTELKENEGRNLRVGFGFLQSTQTYKVAQFFYTSYNFKERRYNMGLEVFTVGQSTCWRALAREPPYPIKSTCSTFTGNCIYFYIWRFFDRRCPNAFTCFHLSNERFSTLYPPDSLMHISVTSMTLTNMKGRLCLSALSHNNTKLSLFTTKIGTNLLGWTPMFSFNVGLPPRDVSAIPIVEHRGKLLIHVIEKKCPRRLELYNTKNGTVQQTIGELQDSRLETDGFRIFANKPWFYISTYEEKAYLNLSECRTWMDIKCVQKAAEVNFY